MKKAAILGAAAASALLFALGLPNEAFPYGFPLLGYIALIPLYCAMAEAPSYGFIALACGLYGALHHALSSYWLFFFHDYALWTLGSTTLVYGLIYAVYGLYLGFFQKKAGAFRPFAFALFWTALEYLKSTGFLGYPWGLLPYTQTRFLPLLQIADATGVYGLSFLLAFINAALAELLLALPGLKMREIAGHRGTEEENKESQEKEVRLAASINSARALSPNLVARYLYAAAGLFAVVLGYGFLRLATPPEETGSIEAVLVQQNSDSWSDDEAGSLARNMNLARQAIAEGRASGLPKPDIVLFSESSLNRPYVDFRRWFQDTPKGDPFTPFVRSTGSYFFTGSPQILDYTDLKMTNSVILIDPEGNQVGEYAKTHPVPFAEAIPFWEVPNFQKFMKNVIGVELSFVMGTRYTIFELPSGASTYRFGAPICFEDAFPSVCRKFVLKGADLLVNLTNDSWSKTDSSEIQHFAAARFRAIEFRRPLVRSTNGGVSSVVASSGKVLATLPLFKATAKELRVPINSPISTFYLIFGDSFAYLCLLLFASWFLILLGREIAERRRFAGYSRADQAALAEEARRKSMNMNFILEPESVTDIERYRAELPSDGVIFVGALRKHPYDRERCLLIADPAGETPLIYEFRVADILSADEMPSEVDDAGMNMPLVKLWVRRGSFGIRYVPFEVDSPIKTDIDSSHLREHVFTSIRVKG